MNEKELRKKRAFEYLLNIGLIDSEQYSDIMEILNGEVEVIKTNLLQLEIDEEECVKSKVLEE